MELQNLKGKVAVITGAGGGIGSAVAESLAKEGMNIVLLGGNHREKLEHTAGLIEPYGECRILPGNLTDFSRLDALAQQARQAFGQVDVLVNNAGMALNCPFSQVTEDQFDRIMKINVKVPYFLTQKLLDSIRKSSLGTIVNIASVVSHAGYPLQSAYTASKHALLGFTKSLAREVYRDGIRVHAICPGGVYTDMVKVARPDLTADGMIMPREIADLVCFLLHYRGNAVIDELNVHRVNKEPFLI